MSIVSSLNLFSPVTEAFGQCMYLAFKAELVTLWSWVREEEKKRRPLLCFQSSADLGKHHPAAVN